MKKSTTVPVQAVVVAPKTTPTTNVVVAPAKTTKKSVSRTTMVKLINETKGRFFTVTFTDKDGQPRTLNCNKKKNSTTDLGYITVWSPKDKGYRNVNPQTLSEFKFDGVTYKAKK